MPIDLGLSRVYSLLKQLNNPHINAYKTIHVAGTNGKGSTVAYLSSILTKSKVRNGRFTSPHMLYYNDCICINDEVYPLSKFQKVSNLVQEQNQLHKLGCTEFELLTVTAFKIFELENVEIAVVEVGLGGRLDATNALEPYNKTTKGGVIATAITKIGIDHENLLGNTLAAISGEKAGIIKRMIPCVLDRTNVKVVVETVQNRANELDVPLTLVDGIEEAEPAPAQIISQEVQDLLTLSPLKGDYQLQNLSVSLKVVELVSPYFLDDAGNCRITNETIRSGIGATRWPGRLQSVQIPNFDFSVLLDGAHNESAAIELGKHLRKQRNGQGIIFVIGMTKGKSLASLLSHIAEKTKDTVIGTSFTPPENMPWISSFPIHQLQQEASQYVEDVDKFVGEDISKVFAHVKKYRDQGDERQVVVCGSLYLCGDVLRLVESGESN
ncbi:folylpolyglutamate synthase [Scheffersomyces stipitis CBS 6054]|uniref:Dihydrofolate synthetase n=1 Tax=Scheffersomyces stipitis (strain ATCC 58785 / CBS 6054 / NBRC 10063 / NRRL Y-11545) TaxID=322104 RepID=A3LWH9_PICST|nr:folylpolyglutamate synthase [Scheffersomyces stipitis CBS 6054]ABN67281.2 folylpolyglutamate synthase [Scheffersomyces stipitis CBS 6054]KAG2734414.1 hypothetical protein G9P44_002420 [Scheffersomyces stipitis]